MTPVIAAIVKCDLYQRKGQGNGQTTEKLIPVSRSATVVTGNIKMHTYTLVTGPLVLQISTTEVVRL